MAITTSGRWLYTLAKNEEPSNEVGRAGLIVLQNPQPGKQGNLGQNVLPGLPVWRFGANIAKSFRVTESKSLQFRVPGAASPAVLTAYPQIPKKKPVEKSTGFLMTLFEVCCR